MSKKKAIKGYNEPFFETHFQLVSISLSEWLVKNTGVTADQLTWWSLISALVGFFVLSLIGTGHLDERLVIIAGIGALAFWILDTIDGKVARLRKKTSLFGAWLDVTFGVTSIWVLLAGVAIYIGDILIGSLFMITYIIKVEYCGTFQRYYGETKTGEDLTRSSYAPNSLSTLVAAMNATNTVCISIFVAAIISYFWSDIFMVMAILYILLNALQAIAMLWIQYGKMKSTR